MPIPIIGTIAGAALGSAVSAGAGIGGSFLSTWLEPSLLAERYRTHKAQRELIPPVDAILDAWCKGNLGTLQLDELLGFNGIPLFHNYFLQPPATPVHAAWWSTAESKRPRLNPAELLSLYRRGVFTTPEELAAQWRWTGATAKDWTAFSRSLDFALTAEDYRFGYMRELYDEASLRLYLQRSGTVSPHDMAVQIEQTKQMPGMQDLVHFMVRESFDQGVVNTEDYARGYPRELEDYARAQGYGWPLGFKVKLSYDDAPDNYTDVDATWGIMYWLAHWQRMSPTQSAEALHRLRPGRVPLGDVWDNASHNRLLKILDYPTKDRKTLELLSYHVLGRIDIRRMQYLGVFDKPTDPQGRIEVKERFQDLGFSGPDSVLQAEYVIRDNTRRKSRELLGVTRQKIQQAYTLGIIAGPDATLLLESIGYGSQEAKGAVSAWQLEIMSQRVTKLIRGIRRNFLLGDYDSIIASQRLAEIGILSFRIAEYVMLWEQEGRRYRLEVAPSVLTDWLYMGIIGEPEFRRRLTAIHWADEDIDRILLAAIFKRKGKPPQDARVPKGKGGRGGESKSGELTRGEIKQLYQVKDIDRTEAAERLRQDGLDDEDAALLLKLWDR